MKFKCVALDFDDCLAHHNDDYTGLFDIFIKQGFSESVVRGAYEETHARGGFSFDNFIDVLKNKGEIGENTEELKKKFDEWVSLSLLLYPDVKDFLVQVKLLKIPVAIVTFGDSEHQKEKVLSTGVLYDYLYVIPRKGEKFTVLEELMADYGAPIAFVDDKPEELDNVREHFTADEVKLFRIIRPRGRHIEAKPRFEYPKIENLTEILSQ
ncbi:MAG: hypothetical protein UX16_C0008G0011 [Parcubacteria group bacterium GW2011_GWB1_45_7]|uniref:FCP1 homology domain-containing protein n=1 Tax=Candidatus Colwellbacteria bacterium RIFCSPLOWO2_02_FULL_45_11 TaxID=1797692 RepID=A0A1G1Z765_9BACT|nr:MAG: hypothetical protein UX16_C0008G0011 [Parcubacteria group bacterium GW2011_GWB1_45_7]OGY60458.1 MAG: hypothetical protein A3I33_02615 [Candidatus Colwellbacteria bacterium RIFCSPLOWO2_02_FULL_45_11]